MLFQPDGIADEAGRPGAEMKSIVEWFTSHVPGRYTGFGSRALVARQEGER